MYLDDFTWISLKNEVVYYKGDTLSKCFQVSVLIVPKEQKFKWIKNVFKILDQFWTGIVGKQQ